RAAGEREGQAVRRVGEELFDQAVPVLRGDVGVRAGRIALGNVERVELVAQLIDGDDCVQRGGVGVPGVIHAHQLRLGRPAGDGEHRAAAVARVQERVDDEVDVVPAALGT